jgi:hypothetical protein
MQPAGQFQKRKMCRRKASPSQIGKLLFVQWGQHQFLQLNCPLCDSEAPSVHAFLLAAKTKIMESQRTAKLHANHKGCCFSACIKYFVARK